MNSHEKAIHDLAMLSVSKSPGVHNAEMLAQMYVSAHLSISNYFKMHGFDPIQEAPKWTE